MQFQVTEIEFDLDCDSAEEELTEQDRIDLYDDYIGTIWEADDGDDLVATARTSARLSRMIDPARWVAPIKTLPPDSIPSPTPSPVQARSDDRAPRGT